MSKTTTTPKTAKTSKTAKKASISSERLKKEALAVTAANLARIDAAERGETAPKTKPTTGAAKPKKGATKSKAAKSAKATGAPKAKKERKPSGLDLAAKILGSAKEPLAARAIAERVIAAGWQTSGKTPHATLYAAIIREIATRGSAARFKKTDRGLFIANT